MPGMKTQKSEVLSIRIPYPTLIGCYDIHELIGESVVNKAMASIVVDALTTLIDVMREERKLPQYLNQEALIERFAEVTGIAAQKTFDGPALPNNEGSVNLDENFVEIADTVSRNVAKDPIADGDVDISGLELDEPEKPPMSFTDLKAAYPEDALIISCEDDALKERALVETYEHIQTSQYGTERAAQLLEATLAIMRDASSETSEPEKV